MSIGNRNYILKGDFNSILFNKCLLVHIMDPKLYVIKWAINCQYYQVVRDDQKENLVLCTSFLGNSANICQHNFYKTLNESIVLIIWLLEIRKKSI